MRTCASQFCFATARQNHRVGGEFSGTGESKKQERQEVKQRRFLRASALAEDRILLTNDKDFAELTFLQQKAAAGIVLIRLPRLRGPEKQPACSRL